MPSGTCPPDAAPARRSGRPPRSHRICAAPPPWRPLRSRRARPALRRRRRSWTGRPSRPPRRTRPLRRRHPIARSPPSPQRGGARRPRGRLPSSRLEVLDGPAPAFVVEHEFLVVAAGVPADHPAPEVLGPRVGGHLSDFPRAAELLEQLRRDAFADPLLAVLAHHEELLHPPNAFVG